MSNLKETSSKEEYNNEPVQYCADCLSLRVRAIAGMSDACYCDECGCTNIQETTIDKWEAMYKEKKGFSFLENKY